MSGALGRIKLAALLATGFIALRVIYAFFFSGLSGEKVLFSIPEFSPGGPFRHVTFFGEVSWDGIQRNIELAIPFALSILVFGTLSALITPQLVRSASSRVKPLRNLLTALAISLSALPGVIAAAKEAGWARRVRGERPLAVIVPIFERMVQRATAAGLELSKADPKVLAGKTLRVSDFSLPGLGPINFDFEPGSVTLLSGETGSGKSTFLQAIAGELMEHHGRASLGSISLGDQAIDSLAASSFVAFVPQLPQQSFVAEKVSLELGAEVSNLNIMGTSRLLEKPTFDLSHGEAYRVALARAVARKPAVLLIDEPSAALDSSGVNQLIELVKKLSTSGAICIIADHRPQLLALPGAQLLEIAGGKLSAPVAKKLALPPLRRVVVGDEVVSKIEISSIGAPEELIGEISFELRQAQCVAITGANGSGKSTLLRRMAEPERGELFVHGVEVFGTDPKRVALVPDRPAQFFVTDSLMNELERADKIAGAQKGLTALTLRSILGKLPDENTHPLDLSIGTQLALSVAMQLSNKPQLLLLDEPVQGLDPESRELMAETIRCVQETGCAVVIATHDLEFANRLSTVVYEICEQRLRQASEVVA